MEYSNGMGIELPQWVITTGSGTKFWNIERNKFVAELTEDCLFDSMQSANDKLKSLDFGYIVKTALKYMDTNNTKIRLQ